MIRRTFLKAIASLLGGGLAVALRETEKPYIHPEFGKYLGHSVRESPYDFGEELPHLRYVTFPTEVILQARFEKYKVEWYGFNVSRDLQRRMERMTPHQLFSGVTWPKTTGLFEKVHLEGTDIVLDDPVSIVWELYPETTSKRIVPGKLAKFKMASISLSEERA